MDAIDHAIELHRRGFHIVPAWSPRLDLPKIDHGKDGWLHPCFCPKGTSCPSPGKHPAVPKHDDGTGYTKSFLKDEDAIRTALSNPGTGNYGVIPPEGVCAIDIDGPGLARWKELEARIGKPGNTLIFKTPNGFHAFYEVANDPGGYLLGIVTRRFPGGFVIGPGSMHPSGVPYEMARDERVGLLNGAWGDEIAFTSKTPRKPIDQVTKGERHASLRDTALVLAKNAGLTGEALFEAVMAVNARLPEPKTPDEVRQAIGHPERVPDWPTLTVQTKPDPAMAGMGVQPATPDAPSPRAYDGTAGEIVRIMDGHTTASPVALLATALATLGVLCPRYLDYHGRQSTAILTGIVGGTGEGKGTAMAFIGNALFQTYGLWYHLRLEGMGSGEGFVREMATLRDGVTDKAGNCVVAPLDPLAVVGIEEELASFMVKGRREGSVLDAEVRKSFDGARLSTGRSGSRVFVNPPYWFGSIGHITPSELRHAIASISLSNGSANRWLWLPIADIGGSVDGRFPVVPFDLETRLAKAREASLKGFGDPIHLPDHPKGMIDGYRAFLRSLPGSRDLTARLHVIALRLAMIHTVIDGYTAVGPDQVRSGIALAEYGRRGLASVFGPATGNAKADTLALAVREAGELTGRQQQDVIYEATERRLAVELLVAKGLVRVESRVGDRGGNPAKVLVWTGLAPGGEDEYIP